MRDIFADLASPEAVDPVERARAHARRTLPKRFYTAVTAEAGEGGWRLLLDGRPVRTPAKRPLLVPTERAATVLAAEWAAQTAEIDPATMPLTRIAHTAIDGVADDPDGVAEEIARYGASDLLVHRAEGPERLVQRQTALWDPIVAASERRLGIRLILAVGVMPIEQDPGVVAAVRRHLPRDAFRLTALHTLTTITGSVLVALAAAEGEISADTAWAAGNLDEDWNAELWGLDAEAARRAAFRRAELDAAMLLLAG